jgi:hypothetical protein
MNFSVQIHMKNRSGPISISRTRSPCTRCTSRGPDGCSLLPASFLTPPSFAQEWVPREQSEPDRRLHRIFHPQDCPATCWGRIDPGNRFPEFLEMCANVSIEHQPHRLGALTPCSQRGTAITAGQQKLHHRMNVTEWGCYTAPLIG